MKTLNNYITEWKANSNSVSSIKDNVNLFKNECPDNNGKCLILTIPIKNGKYISIHVLEYNLDKKIKRIECSNGGFYVKNIYGFYTWEMDRDQYYIHLILFKSDAINFLEKLIEDPSMSININEFKNIIEHLSLFSDTYNFGEAVFGNMYSINELKKYLSELK